MKFNTATNVAIIAGMMVSSTIAAPTPVQPPIPDFVKNHAVVNSHIIPAIQRIREQSCNSDSGSCNFDSIQDLRHRDLEAAFQHENGQVRVNRLQARDIFSDTDKDATIKQTPNGQIYIPVYLSSGAPASQDPNGQVRIHARSLDSNAVQQAPNGQVFVLDSDHKDDSSSPVTQDANGQIHGHLLPRAVPHRGKRPEERVWAHVAEDGGLHVVFLDDAGKEHHVAYAPNEIVVVGGGN